MLGSRLHRGSPTKRASKKREGRGLYSSAAERLPNGQHLLQELILVLAQDAQIRAVVE
ncbi:hypothetical protein CYA_2443 [Synechococcus sp. JA-3-3Ab]|jgi:hypothetical protein|nr:hypothetical protein CYA_2443 [Synechococcus sp. JA-3-3Ab]